MLWLTEKTLAAHTIGRAHDHIAQLWWSEPWDTEYSQKIKENPSLTILCTNAYTTQYAMVKVK